MKKSILSLSILASLIFTTSCQKCYTCQAVDTQTNTIYYQETNVCGSDKDDFESEFNDYSIDSRANCVRE